MASEARTGGFTCSVPGSFNNDKRNRVVSFCKFPNDKKLKKIWLQKISRKYFKPTNGHRVCSQHFEGGKKTYLNNVPTVFPLSKTHQKVNRIRNLEERSSVSAHQRGQIIPSPLTDPARP